MFQCFSDLRFFGYDGSFPVRPTMVPLQECPLLASYGLPLTLYIVIPRNAIFIRSVSNPMTFSMNLFCV